MFSASSFDFPDREIWHLPGKQTFTAVLQFNYALDSTGNPYSE